MAEYAEQIHQIQSSLDEFDDKLEKNTDNYQEYLSSQLKSVWLVMNDVKRTVDSLIEQTGMDRSSDII